MNLEKLSQLEREFFMRYPQGFASPELAEIGKRHKMDQMTEKVAASFRRTAFKDTEQVIDAMIQLTCRSSMVSMFEKPKYRDIVRGFSPSEKAQFADAFRKRLHGNGRKGFDEMLSLLQRYKLAKWSLITILPLYFSPQDEVFVKPTTAKKVIAHLELDEIVYKPQPSWQFYEGFKRAIHSIKSKIDPALAPNNAALTGFLMMAIDWAEGKAA